MGTQVRIPGDGTIGRTWLIAGGALLAGILGYAYLRRAQSTSPSPTADQTATPTELPPADIGSVTTGGGVTDTGKTFITTNAEWAQDATSKLTDLGFDPVAVSTALGKYLSNQFVTKTEAQYIYTALAVSGKPPIGSFTVRLEPEQTTDSRHGSRHHYVAQRHQIGSNTAVRDLVRRYSNNSVATSANVETAVIRTQADPRNLGDIRNGIALAKHEVWVSTIQVG